MSTIIGPIGAITPSGQVAPWRKAGPKKAWAMTFKKSAVLAGVNEPKKSCHGVRKARAEVAAYADCTESQMMAMFGWTAPKMPAHDIAQANRKTLGISGMDKIIAFDQSLSLDDFKLPDRNSARMPDAKQSSKLCAAIFEKKTSKINLFGVFLGALGGRSHLAEFNGLR
jgi:hypothetical protein